MNELLRQLGFIFIENDGLGTDIYQRKTPYTNIMVQLSGSQAIVLRYAPPAHTIHYGTVDNAIDLEVLIASVTTSQLNSHRQS